MKKQRLTAALVFVKITATIISPTEKVSENSPNFPKPNVKDDYGP